MFDKITVKGENKHPLYKWLSTKELNGLNDKEPTWNFCKYVVNEKVNSLISLGVKYWSQTNHFKSKQGFLTNLPNQKIRL